MQRTLTVTCLGGLANRLAVLASGVAVAELTGRRFEMIWPTGRHTCGAGFHQLFDSELPVRDVAQLPDPGSWTMADGHFRPPPDVLTTADTHVRLGYVGWLIDPDRSPLHAEAMARAEQVLVELRLVPHLQSRVDAVAGRFGALTVGAHVRRGDFITTRPDVVANLDGVVATVRSRVEAGADTVFLATDDGAAPTVSEAGLEQGVRAAFRDAFGDRLVETEPRSLDRGASEAIEDSVVDLWLLRRCHEVVGTAASSFSELAVAGRDAPITYCAGKGRPHRRLDRIVEDLGLAEPLARWARQRYGIDVPAVAVTHRLVTSPKRLVRRIVRRST